MFHWKEINYPVFNVIWHILWEIIGVYFFHKRKNQSVCILKAIYCFKTTLYCCCARSKQLYSKSTKMCQTYQNSMAMRRQKILIYKTKILLGCCCWNLRTFKYYLKSINEICNHLLIFIFLSHLVKFLAHWGDKIHQPTVLRFLILFKQGNSKLFRTPIKTFRNFLFFRYAFTYCCTLKILC